MSTRIIGADSSLRRFKKIFNTTMGVGNVDKVLTVLKKRPSFYSKPEFLFFIPDGRTEGIDSIFDFISSPC